MLCQQYHCRVHVRPEGEPVTSRALPQTRCAWLSSDPTISPSTVHQNNRHHRSHGGRRPRSGAHTRRCSSTASTSSASSDPSFTLVPSKPSSSLPSAAAWPLPCIAPPKPARNSALSSCRVTTSASLRRHAGRHYCRGTDGNGRSSIEFNRYILWVRLLGLASRFELMRALSLNSTSQLQS